MSFISNECWGWHEFYAGILYNNKKTNKAPLLPETGAFVFVDMPLLLFHHLKAEHSLI